MAGDNTRDVCVIFCSTISSTPAIRTVLGKAIIMAAAMYAATGMHTRENARQAFLETVVHRVKSSLWDLLHFLRFR